MPVVLVILDGWGIRQSRKGNAIAAARKPFFDHVWKHYPHAVLQASGNAVGLPEGYMGNSEVGHTHIGAGRAVPQELLRVNKSIRDGSFFRNRVLLDAIRHARQGKRGLHLMGLISDAGVHSHIHHLFALLQLAKLHGLQGRTFVHCFLDGRDVPPTSARRYITQLEQFMRKHHIGEIASIMGRYYAMDRDNRWNREHKAYEAIVNGKGNSKGHGYGYCYDNAREALQAAYARGETDEFVKPSLIQCSRHVSHVNNDAMNNTLNDAVNDAMNDAGGKGIAKEGITHQAGEGDAIIFFNFRSDRARELTRAFVQGRFNRFRRKRLINLAFVCLTQYDQKIHAPVAFPPILPRNTLGEIISRHGLRQLRIAETEKYAHVTYFFNNGRERPFPKEDRILVPSRKVTTYDKTPAMSALPITKSAIAALTGTKKGKKYSLIVINLANPDMVGHTGNYGATIKAIACVDSCLREIVTATLRRQGACIITADHGNAEEKTGQHETSHTTNPVPFILISNIISNRFPSCRLKPHGTLQNIAPTVLQLMEVTKPREMASSLIL